MGNLVNKFIYQIRKQTSEIEIAKSRLRSMFIAKNQLLDGGLEGVGVDHNYPEHDNPMIYAGLVIIKHKKCLVRKSLLKGEG